MPVSPILNIRPENWIWDFWHIQDGPSQHLFYLQAPRTLPDPELRHTNVSIGHAVSQDWIHWEILPDVLHPGPFFEEYTWTGSVIKHNNLWYLFYTSCTQANGGYIQTVKYVTSTDLVTWSNRSEPVIELDPRWYEELDLDIWHDQSWRDPWIFKHPETGDFHAFLTARVNSRMHSGPSRERGIVAHATSKDLHNWSVLPPVTQPGPFEIMECPQLVEIEGLFYLLFAVPHRKLGGDPNAGTYYMTSKNRLGPFTDPKPLFVDLPGSLFSGKLIQDEERNTYFIAWRQFTAQKDFIGDILAPIPITLNRDGSLNIEFVAAA